MMPAVQPGIDRAAIPATPWQACATPKQSKHCARAS